jgi:hypothetical protein
MDLPFYLDLQTTDMLAEANIVKRKWTFSILLALLLISIIAWQGAKISCKNSSSSTSSSYGGIITIAWDSSPEPKLGGYKVYYGTSPRKYEKCVDIGKATESPPGVIKYTLTGLSEGRKYYLAVSAYDNFLRESELSKEVGAVAK